MKELKTLIQKTNKGGIAKKQFIGYKSTNDQCQGNFCRCPRC